jgi:hypothetical protein
MKCNTRPRTRLIRNYQRNGKLRNNKLRNVKNCATTHHAGAKGERFKSSHSLLTLALDGGQLSASRPGRALSRKRNPDAHRIGGWVGLRACLDTGTRQKNPSSLPGIEPRASSLYSDTTPAELPDLVPFHHLTTVNKSERIRWARNAALTEERGQRRTRMDNAS